MLVSPVLVTSGGLPALLGIFWFSLAPLVASCSVFTSSILACLLPMSCARAILSLGLVGASHGSCLSYS